MTTRKAGPTVTYIRWLALSHNSLLPPLAERRRFDRIVIGAADIRDLLVDANHVAAARTQCMHTALSHGAAKSIAWEGPRLSVRVIDPDGDVLSDDVHGQKIRSLLSALRSPSTHIDASGVELTIEVAHRRVLKAAGL
jgi:hypothetical protein